MVGKRIKNPFIISAFICSLVIYSGFIKSIVYSPFVCILRSEKIYILKGKICSNPQKIGNKYIFEFSPIYACTKTGESSSCSGKIIIYIPSSSVEVYYPGKLYTACKSTNIVLCENGAYIELYGYLKNNTFFAQKTHMIGWKHSVPGYIEYFRALCRLKFKRLLYAWDNAGGLLLSLLSGSREYLEPVISIAFRNAGLSHILALSGMHLSLVSEVMFYFSTRLIGRKSAYFFQVSAIVLFVWFAGASPSLIRSFLCSLIMLFSSACGILQPDMLVILATSFLIHAILIPGDLYSAAFMLSYGALAGIFIAGGFINTIFSYLFPRKISSDLSTSISAQFFTAPVSLKLFGKIMPGGIIASLVISPLIMLFIYGGIVCMLLCFLCPFFLKVTAFFMKILYTIIKICVLFFSQIPGFYFF
jgi:ComEC/Rec2-related protein